MLLFLDDAKGAMLAALAFAAINTLLTVVTLYVFQSWQGFGFVVASGAALPIAVFRVNFRLAQLELQAGFSSK